LSFSLKSLEVGQAVAGSQVSPDHYALYRGLMRTVREEATESARHALPVAAVVKAVEHAMTSRKPKTRYVLGKDAWFWLLVNLMPDRWRDWLVLSRVRK
jgi:hypothetical protein